MKKGEVSATRRNTTFLLRHEMALSSNMSLKHMFKVDHYGSIQENKANPNQVREQVKGATGYSVGGVLSRWDKDFWENTHLWVGVKPVDNLGVESGSDLEYGVGDSGSFNFGSFGVVTGVWAQYEKFKNERQVYKIENEKIEADGTTLSDNTAKLSLAAQPGSRSRNREFALELPTGGERPDWSALAAENGLRTWPHKHDMDGFFATRLRRQG